MNFQKFAALFAVVCFTFQISFAQEARKKPQSSENTIVVDFGNSETNCSGKGICSVRLSVSKPTTNAITARASVVEGKEGKQLVLRMDKNSIAKSENAQLTLTGHVISIDKDILLSPEVSKSLNLSGNAAIQAGKYKVTTDTKGTITIEVSIKVKF
jgi:hypothetical protein